jgi:hypothetical protein
MSPTDDRQPSHNLTLPGRVPFAYVEETAPAVTWLVRHDYVRNRMEALVRVHYETLVFLALRWAQSSAFPQDC